MNVLFYMKLAAQNIRKNSQTYIPYLLTCIGSVMMYDILRTLSYNEGIGEMRGGGDILTILNLGCWVIALFSAVFLFYTNSFLIKRRKKEIGLYNILGMGKKHIGRILFFETLYLFVLSGVVGILGGFLFSKGLYLLLLLMMREEVQWGFYFSGRAAAASLALYGCIFLAILVFNLARVHLTNPIGLLRGGETGEKEPGTKWLTAFTGLVSLAAGYYLALTIQNSVVALMAFFVAVIFVIIGTYCLFTAGSIALLKFLKKRKSYYYRTEHFISLSGLLYRMKQNAAGLAGICILSTSVLVMLSSTVALYVGMDDVLRTRFPRNLSFHAGEVSDETARQMDQAVREVLAPLGMEEKNALRYRDLSFAALAGKGGDSYRVEKMDQMMQFDRLKYLYFITAQDYNRLTGERVRLQEGEVIVLSGNQPYNRDTFAVFDKTYRAVPAKKLALWDGADVVGADMNLYIIVPDMADLEEIEAKQAAVYGEPTGGIKYHYDFDLEADRDMQAFLYQEIRDKMSAFVPALAGEAEAEQRDSFYSLHAGLLFLGIFLGALFLMATVLIIYYKQVTEGYDDKARFGIMRKVGLSEEEIRTCVRSQIRLMFFLPPAAAALHIACAFPMITKLLSALNLMNVRLYAWCTAGVFAVFLIGYLAVYQITSRVYLGIVGGGR